MMLLFLFCHFNIILYFVKIVIFLLILREDRSVNPDAFVKSLSETLSD